MYAKKLIIIAITIITTQNCNKQITQNNTTTTTHINKNNMENTKEIYLAGGCFWGTEHFMKQIRGITNTQVGYANGNTKNPTYQEVYTDKTGYTETVKVTYNPEQITLELIINLFLKTIDPTSINQQGNDKGTRYRTGIYYSNIQDKQIIQQQIQNIKTKYNKPIAIEILPIKNFYNAEEYHQNYLDKNPNGYCHIDPKLFELAKNANPINENKYKKQNKDTLKNTLTEIQYLVTQENKTETPYQNPYWNETRDGIYVDITTGEPLFVSTDKYNAGCGWPSFTKPIDKKLINEKIDTSHNMIRTEVRSKTGDAHLGHVFTDGPKETGGLRYCINSAALKFIPKENMKQEGYEEYLKLIK